MKGKKISKRRMHQIAPKKSRYLKRDVAMPGSTCSGRHRRWTNPGLIHLCFPSAQWHGIPLQFFTQKTRHQPVQKRPRISGHNTNERSTRLPAIPVPEPYLKTQYWHHILLAELQTEPEQNFTQNCFVRSEAPHRCGENAKSKRCKVLR